jgi:hypothetical protein
MKLVLLHRKTIYPSQPRIIMSPATRVVSTLLFFPVVFLIGCGFTSTVAGPAPAAHLSGNVHGGQQPISGSTVTVWKVGDVNYGSLATALASTTSASDGTFDIPAGSYTCDTPTTQVYITAQGGEASPGYPNDFIMLAAGLGNCSTLDNQQVEINEVSTVVAAFALAQFFGVHTTPATDDFGAPASNLSALALSNTDTIPTILNVADGTVNPNTSTVTIDAAKIYTLANVLAACVNTTAATGNQTCLDLIHMATNSKNTPITPNDTLQVAVNIALSPYANVSQLYALATQKSPFVGLSSAPNDWTIGVSYTTPTMGLGILGTATSGTTSTIDIDVNGRVWFPSNLPGSTGVGYFDPATTTFTGPLNATGVTLTQPQYLAIDPFGFVWITDSLSNQLSVLDTSGATSGVGGGLTGIDSLGPIALDTSGDAFVGTTSAGVPSVVQITPGAGTTGTVSAIGAFANNATGLVWISSTGTAAVFASTSGSGTPCEFEFYSLADPPFYLEGAPTASPCISGGIAVTPQKIDYLTVASSLNEVCSGIVGCTYITGNGVVFNLPEGIATDGYGQEWVANSGNASVTTFNSVIYGYTQTSPLFYQHGPADGNTMVAPYGIAIDGSGNVWVSNASCVTTSATECTPGAFVLSELIGAAGPTITPLSNQGGGTFTGDTPGNQPIPAGKGRPAAASGRRPIPWLTPRIR